MSRRAPIARLALEDGTVYHGTAFGAGDDGVLRAAEVVFNTAMTGYQEALTDPSYVGQILVFTAPMIGNYGVCDEDVESPGPQVAGVVVRELARRPSNPRAVAELGPWLAAAGVPGLEGIDTRALVRRIRLGGAMRGVLAGGSAPSDAELVEAARRSPPMLGRNLAAEVSPRDSAAWREGLGAWRPGPPRSRPETPLRVLALDCGAKRNIYRHLAERGCVVTAAPHDLPAQRILAERPDGLLVSNGPGDPAAVRATVEQLREVAGTVPTLGICLGHQLLALALGAKSFKLPFGHRGANQPVRNVLTGRVEITSQNHGFCVDADSLAGLDCEVTHVHLNDGTVAGFRHCRLPILAVQFHPEASPGPHDTAYLFDCFLHLMRTRRPLEAADMRRLQDRAAQPAAAGTRSSSRNPV